MGVIKDAMEERVYRQSRLCRLLGNPLAFPVVIFLIRKLGGPYPLTMSRVGLFFYKRLERRFFPMDSFLVVIMATAGIIVSRKNGWRALLFFLQAVQSRG